MTVDKVCGARARARVRTRDGELTKGHIWWWRKFTARMRVHAYTRGTGGWRRVARRYVRLDDSGAGRSTPEQTQRPLQIH